MDARCADLVNEADAACSTVIGEITTRFNTLTQEVIIEGEKQCDDTKKLTVEMVKKGAQSSYDMQLELGRQVAEKRCLITRRDYKYFTFTWVNIW